MLAMGVFSTIQPHEVPLGERHLLDGLVDHTVALLDLVEVLLDVLGVHTRHDAVCLASVASQSIGLGVEGLGGVVREPSERDNRSG